MDFNSIVFKGMKEGILVVLDDKIEFNELKKVLKKKLEDNLNFFQDTVTSISFKGRELTQEEEIELIKIICQNSSLNISFFNNSMETYNLSENIKNEVNDKINSEEVEISKFIENLENDTYYYRGSLRGGQCLTHKGSIVVLGDVNPGSKIIAEGNIIVLGKLKGIAHAGCSGAENCFVASLFMDPTQLIINNVITYFPEDIKREIVPEYAYEENGKIFVKQLIKI